MVPKIRAMRRENIDRRQVRGNFRGCFWEGRAGRRRAVRRRGGTGLAGRGGSRRRTVRSVRTPFHVGSLFHPSMRAPARVRQRKENRMSPRFSGIRHVFDKMYKNLSAGLWSLAPRDADAIATLLARILAPPPEKDPTNREIHPWNCIEHPEMQLKLLDFAHIFAHLRFEIGKSHLTNNHIPIFR